MATSAPVRGSYRRLDYVRTARRHLVSLLAFLAIGLLLGVGLHLTSPRSYEARTAVVVGVGTVKTVQDAAAADTASQSGARMALYLGQSALVADDAAKRVGGGATGSDLLPRVSVSGELDSNLLTVAATGPTAQDAKALADAWVAAMQKQFEVPRAGRSMSLDAVGPTPLPVTPTGRPLVLELVVGLVVGLGAWLALMLLSRWLRGDALVPDLEPRTPLPASRSDEPSGGTQ